MCPLVNPKLPEKQLGLFVVPRFGNPLRQYQAGLHRLKDRHHLLPPLFRDRELPSDSDGF